MLQYTRFAQLTPHEEAELLIRIRNGEDKKAVERFITAYIPFVYKVVTKNRSRFGITHDTFEDYMQEGILGLMDALRKYDPAIAHFSTYSTLWIMQRIRAKRMAEQELSGQRPKQVTQRMNILHTQRAVLKEKGRAATVEEIVEHTHLPPKVVAEELAFVRTQFTSIDAHISEDSALADIIPDTTLLSPEARVLAAEEFKAVDTYVASLLARVREKCSARDADIFLRHHGLAPYHTPQKLQQIHIAHGISRERVRQLVLKIWKILEKGNPHFTQKKLAHARSRIEYLPELLST